MASKNIYKTKYVAFVDLLGFKELVARSAEDTDVQGLLLGVLAELRGTVAPNDGFDLRITAFSDSVVMSADRTPTGLLEIIRAIKCLATNVLSLRVFTRGGLVSGLVFHDDHNVFGPALVAAYQLELAAKMPRIQVADDVHTDLATLPFQLDGEIQVREGLPHIHYLWMFARYTGVPTVGELVLDGTAKLIVNHTRQVLRHDRPDVVDKAAWFQAYWNDTVAAQGILPSIVDDDSPLFPDAETPPTIVRLYRMGRSK